ncbi:hypothetical protein HG530_005743 [Fusarium avenaceum]|nr:hypothetical protein HG530_005743 [Fusarium avenaceum]
MDQIHHSANQAPMDKKHHEPVPDMFDNSAGETAEVDMEKQKAAEGNAHFHRLGWKRLTVVLIVEAIALGCLSLPSAFATLGMVAGVILTVGLGFVAIYTSHVVGQVKLAYPQVSHYADAGRLMFGRVGYEVVGVMFALQLIFLVGSHCLTGTIAFLNLTDNGTCSVVFGVVSAIILLLVAIPPSFAEVAILGYIDFVSIALAVGITIIATGIQAGQSDGGMSSVDWSAWPKEGLSFTEAFIAITNIVFAYSFAVCQFSFMDEMHTPGDYVKSIWSLGLIEIAIYTLTGALIYAFVGSEVKSPALLSAGPLISKIAFGVALPVIFISGSINTTVVGRYIHGRVFKDSIIRYINTKMGWITWLVLVTVITIVAFVIAEAIPFFNDLLSISSSLFISGFTFYFPAIMWFMLIRKGPWHSKENLLLSIANGLIFIIGMIVLVGGTYASIDDIILKFDHGELSLLSNHIIHDLLHQDKVLLRQRTTSIPNPLLQNCPKPRTLCNILHQFHNRTELVRQPGDNRTSSCGGRVHGVLEDVLAGEHPVSPAETSDVVEDSEVQHCKTEIAGFGEEISHADLYSCLADVLEECAVRLGAVFAELDEDIGKRVLGHWDLADVVQERNNGIVGSRFSTEELRLVVVLSLVDNTIREHGLLGDAVDKGSVGHVILWKGLSPHALHVRLDDLHGVEDEFQASLGLCDLASAVVLLDSS